ncbi:hypothetical protein pVco7_gp042 [Vibrio phage pVco-7]|uniref:Uncharacterized protein n=1 Tax=Vibrio phage pVco-5 TaxID=1965485 RepID=A0A1W6JUT5_9CAUD|nr:hypothetical protein KNT61_gp043 [Vibrio phage pVco-5]ARM71031.1 hypothetical protein pVco5_043 [Vibrio phage pVco-5]
MRLITGYRYNERLTMYKYKPTGYKASGYMHDIDPPFNRVFGKIPLSYMDGAKKMWKRGVRVCD